VTTEEYAAGLLANNPDIDFLVFKDLIDNHAETLNANECETGEIDMTRQENRDLMRYHIRAARKRTLNKAGEWFVISFGLFFVALMTYKVIELGLYLQTLN